MSEIELKDPRFFITRNSMEIVKKLRSMRQFKRLENKDFFMLAFAFGLKDGARVPLERNDIDKNGFFRENLLSPEEKAVLKCALFAQDQTADAIMDTREMIELVQEYANSGFALLANFIRLNQSVLEKELSRILKAELSENMNIVSMLS